jgi:hypothetical protein
VVGPDDVPGVMWTFLGIPRAIALVGDSCTMWARRIEKPKVRNSGDRKGSKRESFWKPKSRSPPKSRTELRHLRFHSECQSLDVG